jgi:hypothetical protein
MIQPQLDYVLSRSDKIHASCFCSNKKLPELGQVAVRADANHTDSLTKANAGRALYVSAVHLGGHIDPCIEAVVFLFENIAG